MKTKDGVKFTNEIRAELMKATSAEDLRKIADGQGVEITEEEAEKLFGLIGKEDLSDEEMEFVAGGGCCDNYCEYDYICKNDMCGTGNCTTLCGCEFKPIPG